MLFIFNCYCIVAFQNAELLCLFQITNLHYIALYCTKFVIAETVCMYITNIIKRVI